MKKFIQIVRDAEQEHAFLEEEGKLAEAAARSLANDTYIFAATKNWNKLSHLDRCDFVRYFALVSASALGAIIPMVEFYNEPPSNDGTISCGGFKKSGKFGKTLRINTNPIVFDDLQSIMKTVIHENGHYRQLNLMEKKSTSTYIAVCMAHERDHYISSSENHKKYEGQLIEKHARIVEHKMGSSLATNSLKKLLSLDLEEDEKIQEEFATGYVSIGRTNGAINMDPRRHYFNAILLERKLERHSYDADPQWGKVIEHYKIALACGEHVIGFDPVAPAFRLAVMAANFKNNAIPEAYINSAEKCLWKDDAPDHAKKEMRLSEDYQKKAADCLRAFTDSPREPLRVAVTNILNKLHISEENDKIPAKKRVCFQIRRRPCSPYTL